MTSWAFTLYRKAVRFGHDTEGGAMVELALVIPFFLAPMLLGAYDFAMAFVEKLRLEQAARAGGQVALVWGNHSSGTEVEDFIKAGVRQDYGPGASTLNVDATFTCSCLDGTTVTNCVTAQCATPGEIPKRRLDITAVKPNHQLTISWPGIGNSVSLTGDTSLRVK